MTQLLQLKEREKNAARDGWQKKVEDLLDQVIWSLWEFQGRYNLVTLLPISYLKLVVAYVFEK